MKKAYYLLGAFLLSHGSLHGMISDEVEYVSFDFPHPTYLQEIVIQFPDEDTASLATIKLAPLFDNYERAVSCRWDDNIAQNLEAKQRLDERGIKATFYLNSNDIFYLTDENYDYTETAMTLLEGGHSIGSHGLTHPYLTYISRDRMLEELVGGRVEWESATDSLINSHAFSFINYRNQVEGDVIHRDILRSLERAGLYHAPVFNNFEEELPSDFIESVIMPPENQSFEEFKKAVDWAVSSEVLREERPLISHSMHAWYGTPALEFGFDELVKRLDYLNQFGNFWQCNQNQYAAYRYQYEHSRVLDQTVAGDTVSLLLERPALTWLNDPTPLTLLIEGEGLGAIPENAQVQVQDSAVPKSDRSLDNILVYNLPHNKEQFLPDLIDSSHNPDNSDDLNDVSDSTDFPGVKGLVYWDSNTLNYTLENTSDNTLTNVTLTFRLPIPWTEGVKVYDIPDIGPGDVQTVKFVPSITTADPKYQYGMGYAVAQLDFQHADTGGRIYSTVYRGMQSDDSLPGGKFEVYGPMDGPSFNHEAFAGWMSGSIGPFDGGIPTGDATVQPRDPESDCKFDPVFLDPEIVFTNCNWYDIFTNVFVLQSIVTAHEKTPFKLLCFEDDIRGIFINGEKVEGFNGEFPSGESTLTIVYHHEYVGQGLERNSAAWMRFVDPEYNERLSTIAFRKP